MESGKKTHVIIYSRQNGINIKRQKYKYFLRKKLKRYVYTDIYYKTELRKIKTILNTKNVKTYGIELYYIHYKRENV